MTMVIHLQVTRSSSGFPNSYLKDIY